MGALEELAGIRARVEEAQRRRARAEADRENASRRAEEARRRLKEDFGVSTAEEARAEVTRLEQELTEEIARIKRALT